MIIIKIAIKQVRFQSLVCKNVFRTYCSNSRATRARERVISSSLHGVLSSWDIIDPSRFMVNGVAIDGCDSAGTDTGRDRSMTVESRRANASSEHCDMSSPSRDSLE